MATKTLQRAGWARVAKQHHHHSPSSWRRPPFPLYRARCQRMPFVAQFTATPEYESVNIFPNDSVRSCVCVCALFPRVEGFACLYPPACMLFLLFVPLSTSSPTRVAVHSNIISLHCSLCFFFRLLFAGFAFYSGVGFIVFLFDLPPITCRFAGAAGFTSPFFRFCWMNTSSRRNRSAFLSFSSLLYLFKHALFCFLLFFLLPSAMFDVFYLTQPSYQRR